MDLYTALSENKGLGNCTLWQVLARVSAGATCQCVQCVQAIEFQNFCAVGKKIKIHSGRQ